MLLASVATGADDLHDASPLGYTFGVHYDSICLATVSAAAVWQPTGGWGLFAQASPGIRGGKISLGGGYAVGGGPCGSGSSTVVDVLIAAAKVSYLYAWDPPAHGDDAHRFIGIELEGGATVSGSIGVFRALDPGSGGRDWRVAWSLGIGL